MRITSPKNILIASKQPHNSNNEPKFVRQNQNLITNTQKFKSFHTSRHSSRMQYNEEYTTQDKKSNLTQQLSSRTHRSKSKTGISMSRDKTIKIDNIYQPQHFGQKNNQNISTKSVTQSSKNAKSTSRMTRATNPTVTYFPQHSQQPTQKSLQHDSMRQIGLNSQNQNNFDFKELRKQLNNINKNEQNSMKLLPQEEQYYSSKTYQLNQNIYHNKKIQNDYSMNQTNLSSNQQNNLSSQTNLNNFAIENKVNKTVSLWVKKPSKSPSVHNQYNLAPNHQNSEYNINMFRSDKGKNNDKTSEGFSANGSSKNIEQNRQPGLTRITSNNKLNWKDVIIKK